MLSIKWLVGLICILEALSSVRSEPTPEQQCPTPTNTPIKFLINSRRNSTGYWISQLSFKNGGERKNPSDVKETPPFTVEMEQNTVACGGVESALHVQINVAVPPPIAGPGYELFPGFGYYKFHPVITNWDHAREVCAAEGSHLVIINTDKESDIVKTLFSRHPTIRSPATDNWGWVGLRETGTNGKYFTVFGEPLATVVKFFQWVPSQPNDVGTNDCLVVTRSAGAYEDCPCTNGYPFICEQEIW